MLIDLPENVTEETLDGVAVFSDLDNWGAKHDGIVRDYHEWIKKNHAVTTDKVVVDREERIQELQLLLNVLQHDEPQKGHDGGCHPDAGCDGDCANYYYHWQEVRKAEAKLDVLRAQAKEGGEG